VRRLTRRPASSPVESGYRRRPAGSLTAGAVLAIALVISIAGSIVTYRQVSNAFARYRDFEQANELVTSLLGFQLDEQSGLRGFLASGRRTFLQAGALATAAAVSLAPGVEAQDAPAQDTDRRERERAGAAEAVARA